MDRVCKWAHERMLQRDFVLLDTETTSLEGEIVDLAMLGAAGETIFDSLIKPVGRTSEAARAVHHISDAMLERAPSFADLWPDINALLVGKIIITYNAKFDFTMMISSLLAHDSTEMRGEWNYLEEEKWHCLMNKYQEHVCKSRWQKLEVALMQQGLPASNTHRALADAQAAYSLLAHLAGKYEGSSYEARQKAQTTQISQIAGARGRDNASE